MLVCRTFEQIVTPLLYALITTTPDVRPVSVIRLLVRTLLARPERASLAQTLVAGPVGPEFAIRPGGDRSDWREDPKLHVSVVFILASMRYYLESQAGCSAMTSQEMLLSQDVALVIILKLCTRLTTLDLEV
jgi:hypothetical protein